MPSVTLPLPWWRLPFAGALVLHGAVLKRCQLCRIQVCEPIHPMQLVSGGHPHWFNRLTFLCHACHQHINWGHSPFHFTIDTPKVSFDLNGVASTSYTFPFDTAMRRFKNSQQLDALPILVHAIRQLALPERCHFKNTVLMPVPTTTQRLQERGFAPLWWLTQYLSFHWQLPIFTGVTREERAHQQGLSRDERLVNVQDAFHLTDYPSVSKIILFDDVVTTGATMSALAKTLLAHNPQYQLTAIALLHGK